MVTSPPSSAARARNPSSPKPAVRRDRVEAGAVVGDLERHPLRLVGERHDGRLGPGVAPDVGQRLLRRRAGRRPRRCRRAAPAPLDGRRHLYAGLAGHRVGEPGERLDEGARLEVPGRELGDDDPGLGEVVDGGASRSSRGARGWSRRRPGPGRSVAARDRAMTEVKPWARVSWISRERRLRSSCTPCGALDGGELGPGGPQLVDDRGPLLGLADDPVDEQPEGGRQGERDDDGHQRARAPPGRGPPPGATVAVKSASERESGGEQGRSHLEGRPDLREEAEEQQPRLELRVDGDDREEQAHALSW